MSITPEEVRELLIYNPESGEFRWRERDRKWFQSDRIHRAWNARNAGNTTGRVWTNTTGYQCRKIQVLGREIREHKLAWMWMTGEAAPKQIDHKDRDATNNKWRNLRASTNATNGRNRSMHKNNLSGVTGVSWASRSSKWVARCRLSGKCHHLGYFDQIDEAAMEVMEFRIENGFDPMHGMQTAHYWGAS